MVYTVSMCECADMHTAHLLEQREEEKNCKRIMTKDKAGFPICMPQQDCVTERAVSPG